MALYFTCVGSIRGSCGVNHRTVEAAVRCQRRDKNSCRKQSSSGYSDRNTVAVEDGKQRPLTDAEAEWMYTFSQHSR